MSFLSYFLSFLSFMSFLSLSFLGFHLGRDKKDSVTPPIKETMDIELNSPKRCGAYEEVKDCGQCTTSMRWVVTEKPQSSGKSQHKARLVCRGFEEDDDQFLADSPTVEKASVRIFLAISGMFHWKTHSVDIKSAFLQSEDLDREVFVRPPANIKKQGVIWRLLKPLYGLVDSSRNWYFSLKKKLEEIGFLMCSFDKALFYWKNQNKLQGIVLIHVDDLLYGGSGMFLKTVKTIFDFFKISKSEMGSCRYIGLDITNDEEGILLNQHAYSELVQAVEISTERRKSPESNLTEEEITEYRSLVGKMNWLSCNSRPDLKFDVFFYSQFSKQPTVKHLLELNNVAKRVHKSPTRIRFPVLDTQKLRLILYTDASLGNLEDKLKSCKAFIVFIADERRCCPIAWNFKKIDRVSCDTREPEAKAMKFGIIHAVAINNMMREVLGYNIPIHCFIDSKTLERSCFSTKNVSDPILKRDIGKIQQMIKKGELTKVVHVKSADQLADVMTKKGVNPAVLREVLETGRVLSSE